MGVNSRSLSIQSLLLGGLAVVTICVGAVTVARSRSLPLRHDRLPRTPMSMAIR